MSNRIDTTTADDIVERLRRLAGSLWGFEGERRLLTEAADEITRLRAQPATPREEGDWVLVPRALDRAMLTGFAAGFAEPAPSANGVNSLDHMDAMSRNIWARVLAAAPTPSSTVTEEAVERAARALLEMVDLMIKNASLSIPSGHVLEIYADRLREALGPQPTDVKGERG